MTYEQRTIRRLLRHVSGVTIKKPTPTSYYHDVTIGGVTVRALVGDGFLTFGVRRASHVERKWDTGLAVVCVPKIQRDRALLRMWLAALHECAAKVQRESAERQAEFFRRHEALSFPEPENARESTHAELLGEIEEQNQYFEAMHRAVPEDS